MEKTWVPSYMPGMLAYGYKKIVASSRSVIGSLNDSGVPAIWLPHGFGDPDRRRKLDEVEWRFQGEIWWNL